VTGPSPVPTCAAVQGDLAELALGTLAGRERADALSHLAGCPRCRAELERLSEAADALVQLAPPAEPPVGFEVRLFDRLGVVPRPEARRRPGPGGRAVRVLLAAAAVVVAVALAFGAGWAASPGTRSPSLGVTGGDFDGRLVSARLTVGDHADGEVLVYSADPSWMFMTVADAGRSAEVTCEVTTRGGRTVRVGTFWLSPGGYGAWGTALPVPAAEVRSARVVARDGTVLASAVLDA